MDSICLGESKYYTTRSDKTELFKKNTFEEIKDALRRCYKK